MNSPEFIALVVAEFPELASEIEEDAGLAHVQMGTFCRYTEDAIASGDMSTVDRCFSVADRGFRDADPDLKNAFYVSFLEYLQLSGPNGSVKERMSPLLQQGYKDIMDYMEQLGRAGRRNHPDV